ncbi:hypothetical protein HGA91_03570 [candidate division WWE3 bacterium]|nr:hypothetical protein [candidate division WWE3 bacterium]
MKKILPVLGKLPWHALVFTLYPAFFYFAINIDESDITQLMLISLFSLVIFVIVFIMGWLFIRDIQRAGFLTTIFAIIFFSHGHIIEAFQPIPIQTILFVFWGVVLVGSLILLVKYKQIFPVITRTFNVIGITLIFSLVVTVVPNLSRGSIKVRTPLLVIPTPTPVQSNIQKSKDELPDIYYFIFDRYAGDKTLKEMYSYDNQKLTDFFKDRGFYFLSDSHTNYPRTSYSLATSLNMEYLPTLKKQLEESGNELGNNFENTVVIPMLTDNRVVHTLRSFGYEYYHLGSWYEPTKASSNASDNLMFDPVQQLDGFTGGFIYTTILSSFINNIALLDRVDLHIRSQQYAFSELPELVTKKGPKFVFAHILVPHEPYVSDANCNVKPLIERYENTVSAYIEQLKCGNQQIMSEVDRILSQTDREPIIIIQSDEGPNPLVSKMKNMYTFDQSNTDSIHERTRILNAIYFPDQDYAQLYSTLTPVNTFRLIFSQYFGMNLPLYPDETYIFQSEADFLQFNFVKVDPE